MQNYTKHTSVQLLTSYAKEIIRDISTDHIFNILRTFETQWEYKWCSTASIADFNKAYHAFGMKVLC